MRNVFPRTLNEFPLSLSGKRWASVILPSEGKEDEWLHCA